MAPSLGVSACSVEGEETPYLQPHEMAASVSYRFLHSFRDFHFSEEIPFPSPNGIYAETYVHGFIAALAYQATKRISLTLEIPFQAGSRTTYYEHDLTTLSQKHTMRASGLGDVKLVGTFWLLDPEKHREGNITLGLGVKIPTGDYNAKDFSYRDTGPVLRPVDPAIQPGDGGWGIVTEIAAFQKLYKNSYAYLQGTYLINPRETNGTQQPTGDEPDFTLGEFGYIYNSVPINTWGVPALDISFGQRWGCLSVSELASKGCLFMTSLAVTTVGALQDTHFLSSRVFRFQKEDFRFQ